MTVDPVEVSVDGIQQTIRLLREAGSRECVLLWLAQRFAGIQRITRVYRPIQKASIDYFEIPRQGMAELMACLRTEGLYVASQVHTHPGEAFHSRADDQWAIVRHRGALSVVLPQFAATTTPDSFLLEAAVYQLNSSNAWIRVNAHELRGTLRVVA